MAQPPPPPSPPGPPSGPPAGPQPWGRPAAPPPGPGPGRGRTVAIAAAVVLVGAGVVALGLAGNGDGDGGTPVASGDGDGRTEQAGGPDADLTVDDLEPALLTIDDVPDGYVAGDGLGDEESEDEPLTADEVETDPACREALEQLEGRGADEGDGDVLTAAFELADDGVSVSHDLWLMAPGAPTIGELADLLRQCESLTYEADELGTLAELRISVEEVDDLGDEAIAVETEVEIERGFTLRVQAYNLFWSRAGVQSTLIADGGFDPVTMEGGEPDRDLARSAAEAVDERIRDVTRG